MLLDFSLRLRLASVLGNASLPDATNCVKRCVKRGDADREEKENKGLLSHFGLLHPERCNRPKRGVFVASGSGGGGILRRIIKPPISVKLPFDFIEFCSARIAHIDDGIAAWTT